MIENISLITKKLTEERDVNYRRYKEDIRAVCTARKQNLDLISENVPEEMKVEALKLKSILDESFRENPLLKDFNKVPTSTLSRLMKGSYESTIQGIYRTQMDFISSGRIRIIDRGRTDGIMEFYDGDKFLGYGLIEYKRKATGKNRWGQNVLIHGLLQAIGYYFRVLSDFEKKHFKVFCVACEDYFYFVNKADIQELLDKLEDLIVSSDLCPSSLYKDYSMESKVRAVVHIDKEIFHRVDIDSTSMFNGIIEELFLNLKYVA